MKITYTIMRLLVLVSILTIAGCATPPLATPTIEPATISATTQPTIIEPTKIPEPTPTNVAKRGLGGNLNLLWWQGAMMLNVHLASGTADYEAARLVLEPLAAVDPEGNLVPILASEIPSIANGGISVDLKTITWKLKQGVKWSDGTDFTADDVVFTYTYITNPDTAATTAWIYGGAEKVEALDPYSIRITWKEPNVNPFQMFVSKAGYILQKKQFAEFIGKNASTAPGNLKPIGTGPYVVTDFKSGDVVTYEINPNYRDPDKPFFKHVQFKGGGDATSAARAVFQTGDVDYAANLQVEIAVLNQLLLGGKGELITATSPNVEYLLVNRADPNKEVNGVRSEPSTPHPFLSDLKVRQALSMSIDRKQIETLLYGPLGTATCNMLPAPAIYASPNTKCNLDSAKAAELLDEAGWKVGANGIREKDGVKMKILFQTTVNPVKQKTQELVKKDWEALGIQVELKAIPSDVFWSSDLKNPDTAAKFYADVEMFTYGTGSPEPSAFLSAWTCDKIAQKSNSWSGANYERFCNSEYDAAIQQLNKETDPTKRKELIIKLNDILVNDVADIPLIARNFPVSGKSVDLKGVLPTPWDSDLWNIADWYK